MTTTFRKGVGRLAADRYDFQDHIDGKPPHHKAGIITLEPSVVINSVTHTNVQDAIEELAPFAVTVPDATSTVKGVIKLSGDLSDSVDIDNVRCSASRIQGRTVLSTAPTSGQILIWGGTSWAPGTINEFEPGGDLDGDFLSQEVITITGTGTGPTGYVEMRCPIVSFTSLNPAVISMPNIAAAGNSMTIKAQNSTANNAGDLVLSAGYTYAPTIYKQGTLSLATGAGALKMLQITEPNDKGRFVLSLCGPVTDTEMPIDSGGKVIYIANADSVPVSSPTSGTILYSDSGSLWIKESGGTNFQINNSNKLVFQDISYSSNISSAFSGWNEFFSTTLEDYEYAMWTGNHVAQIGDVVKITFSGYVANSSSNSGYACILINGLLGDTIMPGGEIYIDLPSIDPSYITLTSIYTIIVPDTIRAVVAMKADSDDLGTMYMYGGASLIIEVIRP